MPYTREQFVRSVAERLGLVGDGQPVEASDAAVITEGLPAAIADLIGRQVVSDVNLDDIPDEHYQHLSALVANEMADRFTIDDALAGRLAARALVAEHRIRMIEAAAWSGAPVKVCFY